ncbi:unnamed protein product [Gordionus sp. m RMFG-2023]|uniref:uncharacterized protein LOC135927955 isoform X2 n=1 Tax=Gordionus sp. m RMFG-2023 TaxID=3053472 RepID=UPI0030E38E7E
MDLFDLDNIPLPTDPNIQLEVPLPFGSPLPLQDNTETIKNNCNTDKTNANTESCKKGIKNAFQIGKITKFRNLSFTIKKPNILPAIEKLSHTNKANEKVDIQNGKNLHDYSNKKTLSINATFNNVTAEIPKLIPNSEATKASKIDKTNPEELLVAQQRKRKSRWGENAPVKNAILIPVVQTPYTNYNAKVPSMIPFNANDMIPLPPNNVNSIPIPLVTPIKTFNNDLALQNSMSDEQRAIFEEAQKMRALCSYIIAKAKISQHYEKTGKVKYEYDSDEDITDGTWEHKRRKAEMERTKEISALLTDMGRDKHHVGDFLPPEELERFLYTYESIKQADAESNNIQPIDNGLQTNVEQDKIDEIKGLDSTEAQEEKGDMPDLSAPDINVQMTETIQDSAVEVSCVEQEKANIDVSFNNSTEPAPMLELTEMNDTAQGQVVVSDIVLPPIIATPNALDIEARRKKRLAKFSEYSNCKINSDNIGYRILMKMGWDEEHGLGLESQGITEPVNKATVLPDRMGLGTLSQKGLSNDLQEGDDEFDAYRKRMMLAYRFRPNPLNNPRRAYY